MQDLLVLSYNLYQKVNEHRFNKGNKIILHCLIEFNIIHITVKCSGVNGPLFIRNNHMP